VNSRFWLSVPVSIKNTKKEVKCMNITEKEREGEIRKEVSEQEGT
jgi:hypothetical protein